jgi:hypothetical protein
VHAERRQTVAGRGQRLVEPALDAVEGDPRGVQVAAIAIAGDRSSQRLELAPGVVDAPGQVQDIEAVPG